MRKIVIVLAAIVVVLVAVVTLAGYFLFSGDAIRAAIEQQASTWLGQPVRIGEARVGLFPRASVRLRDIEVGQPAQVTLADVQVSTNLGALLRRRIEDARVVIADSVIQMPLPFAIPTGDDTDESARDDGAAAIELVSVSEISLRDVRITSRGREVAISADSALAGSHLTLEAFTAESGGTSLTVTGEADLEPRIDARLQIEADRLDLDELIALAEAFTPESSARGGRATGGGGELPHISAQLTADSATAAGVELSSLTADMEVDGDRVRLAPLAFGLFDGRYEGTLDVRVGETMNLTLDSRLEGLDVAQLAAFGGSPDTITGTLAGQGTFTAQGADMAAALAGARGSGSAAIADGTIQRLGLVRTVVLFFGNPAPDTAASTNSFERIETTFSLARQVFSADTFQMRSRDADVTGSGTLALEGKALGGSVQLLLSEELSAQAGSDLSRYTLENNRVVLPARLGGTLDEPRITIDAAAAIKRGLTNEIQRRLRGLFGGDDQEP
jgi:hypothetical protein